MMNTLLKPSILITFISLAACQHSGDKTVMGQPAINYLKLLQGPWEDSGHQINYIKDSNIGSYSGGKLYTSRLEIKHDTLWMPGMLHRSQGSILNISKDSLIVRIIGDKDIQRFWRPSIEELKKDTVTVIPDSLIHKDEKTILGNKFELYTLSEMASPDHIFLRIQLKDCKDSCIKLVHDLWFKGGDCNSDLKNTTVYEFHRDSLFFYTENDYVEHLDNTHPHPSTFYEKETYVIRQNGDIVRIKDEDGKKKPNIVAEIEKKLEELKWQ